MTDNWSGAGNWNGGLPVAGDDVHIAPNDGVALTVNYNVNAPPLEGFLVDLTGPGAERTTFEMASGTLSNTGFIVGAHGRATFNQSGGTHTQLAPYDGAIGHYAGGNGVYNLSGTGTLSLSRDLYLGLHTGSAGAFNQTGGSVAVARNMNLGLDAGAWGGYSLAAGELSVGAGMSVGGNGVGSFEQSGGEVVVNGAVAIGEGSGPGAYSISSGALSAASMRVMRNGAFQQSGGVVAVGSILVDGYSSTIAGMADFSGGATTVTGEIALTFFGTSDNPTPPLLLRIRNGARVVSSSGRLEGDLFAFNPPIVEVRDPGSQWTITGSLEVGIRSTLSHDGYPHPAKLFIADGAVVVGGALHMSQFAELRLQSGTLVASQYFPGSGFFNWTGGVLSVGSYAGQLTIPAGGTLAPATSVGAPSFRSSAILGNYTQSAGAALAIEIGGAIAAVNHDFVDVAGAAQLGGLLKITMANGYIPSSNSTFTVFNTAGGITGSFATASNGQRIHTVDGIGSFLVNYGPGSPFDPNKVVLSAFQLEMRPGDFDLDGDVDGADFLRWQRGQSPNPLSASDLATWRSHFAAAVPAAAHIPEPAGATLLVVALAALFSSRRGRCGQGEAWSTAAQQR